MKNLKDAKTKIFPSKTRGGKGLPSSSALESPSIICRLATLSHAINPDMSQVIDASTSMILMMMIVPCLTIMTCR